MHAERLNAPDLETALANAGRLGEAIILLMEQGASKHVICAVAGEIVDLAAAGSELNERRPVALRAA